jgi:hypothetical protein
VRSREGKWRSFRRALAAAVEASPLVLRARVLAVLVKVEAVINLVPRVPPVLDNPFVRVGEVRKAPVCKPVRGRRRLANSCQALLQSKAVSTINIANLAKAVHAAQVAPAVQAAQLANAVQVSQTGRVVRPNKVVHGVRAQALASQRVAINLDQVIQLPDRHRKVMIGSRAGPQRMSPGWGLLSRRAVDVSVLSVLRG